MEGVKSLVVGTKNLPVTRIVDAIMDHKNIPESEGYRYFDPKMIKVTDASQQRNKFQEVRWYSYYFRKGILAHWFLAAFKIYF